MFAKKKQKPIYLDYAASTPLDPEVEAAMRPYFIEHFGNPGSVHAFGQSAIAALDRSREIVSRAIGAEFREILFTGSATEANNLALRGVVGHTRQNGIAKPHIIVSAIEHESVLETARSLERDGVAVTYLPVSHEHGLDLAALQEALTENTVIVSCMYANNETGSVLPIRKIAEIIAAYRKERGTQYPLLHTDAVQAFQFFDCNVQVLGTDLMTLSAHKLYGPKGVGALYIKLPRPQSRASDALEPLIVGGGQEYGVRSGTENIPLIVGLTKAIELVNERREAANKSVRRLRNLFLDELTKLFPSLERNGVHEANVFGETLPNIVNIYLPNIRADEALVHLDLAGIAVAAGSACTARSLEPSYVLLALGYPRERALQSLRISFGRTTTENEVRGALRIFKEKLAT